MLWSRIPGSQAARGPRGFAEGCLVGAIRSRSFAERIGTSAAVPKFVAEVSVGDQDQTRLAGSRSVEHVSVSRAAWCRSGTWQGCTPSYSLSPPVAVSASAAACPSNMRTSTASPCCDMQSKRSSGIRGSTAIRVVIGAGDEALYRRGDGRARPAAARGRRRRAAGHRAARPGKSGRAGTGVCAHPRRGTAAGIGRGDRPGRGCARRITWPCCRSCRWSTA